MFAPLKSTSTIPQIHRCVPIFGRRELTAKQLMKHRGYYKRRCAVHCALRQNRCQSSAPLFGVPNCSAECGLRLDCVMYTREGAAVAAASLSLHPARLLHIYIYIYIYITDTISDTYILI